MYCPKCGANVEKTSNFCNYCGTALNDKELHTICVRCKSCNSVMEVDRDRQLLSCPNCGSVEIVVESDAVTVERIGLERALRTQETSSRLKREELDHEEAVKARKEKREWKTVIIIWSILGIAFAAVMLYCFIRDADSVRVPCSSDECIGELYTVVEQQFRDAGFSDVELMPIGTSGQTEQANKQVYKITVNGIENFDRGIKFPNTSKVSIYYSND